jgi:hypothetical protein
MWTELRQNQYAMTIHRPDCPERGFLKQSKMKAKDGNTRSLRTKFDSETEITALAGI